MAARKKQPPHGTGDESLAINLEADADRAEPQPNWDELAAITTEVDRLRASGGLDDARGQLLVRMRNAIPLGPLWQYLVDRKAAEILRD